MVLGGSHIGSHIGNGIVVGGAEYGAIYGIGVESTVLGPFWVMFFGFVSSKRLTVRNKLTMSDILNHRYGARITGTIFLQCSMLGGYEYYGRTDYGGKNLFSYFE